MDYHEDPRESEKLPDEEHEEEYAFLQETRKDEKSRGRIGRSTLIKCACLGLVFGIAASLGFFALKPWAQRLFLGNPDEVTIPEDQTEETEKGSADTEEASAAVSEGAETEETPALSLDNYREMNTALFTVGNEAERFVAEITGVSGETDLSEAGQEETGVSGVIVADNGPEYLIFASSQAARSAEEFQAEFVDGKSYRAEMKQRDENLGFAVYSVQKAELSESTKGRILVAELGSSGTVSQGDTIIALGSPFGYGGAMGFGVVASPNNTKQNADGEYRLLCTDISGAENGTGVLVNINGEVVGMIDQSISGEESANLVIGYGISDLKSVIERLSNGKAVPYLGITGVTVTEELASEQGLPKGVYVQEVQADSPAMEAGIQSGDVIVEMGKDKISTLSAYHSLLMKQEAGNTVKLKGRRKGAGDYVEVDYTVTVGSRQ